MISTASGGVPASCGRQPKHHAAASRCWRARAQHICSILSGYGWQRPSRPGFLDDAAHRNGMMPPGASVAAKSHARWPCRQSRLLVAGFPVARACALVAGNYRFSASRAPGVGSANSITPRAKRRLRRHKGGRDIFLDNVACVNAARLQIRGFRHGAASPRLRVGPFPALFNRRLHLWND